MSNLPVDLLIFDLTGTTVRDHGATLTAFTEALEKHGIPYSEADTVWMRGASKPAIFQSLAERAFGAAGQEERIRNLANEAYLTFKERLHEAYSVWPMVEVPGARDTLRWLRERGLKIAATSGLDREFLDLILDRLGWREGLFDTVVSADEVHLERPAPYMIFLSMMRTGTMDVRRVAVVGDNPLDLQAGMNAGAGWVIGVLTGPYALETLGTTPHTHLLSGIVDLPDLLQGR